VFGIDSEKLVILAVITAVVLGPQRLPEYARKLAEWIRSFRNFADKTQAQLSEELGEDVDWRKLDPRQYDPRRIIREALLEDPSAIRGHSAAVAATTSTAAGAGAIPAKHETTGFQSIASLAAGEAAPFDHEAT
jgi:sec-independent protein translocase protein TatB